MSQHPPRSLTVDERRWLLDLARSTIEARLEDSPLPDRDPPGGPLNQVRGAFVTLTEKKVLRGCIGHVVGVDPLWLSVRSNAINAAFHDPRFPPVERSELRVLMLEISALSSLWRVSEPRNIVIGRDGIIIERGPHRGLLLPQVAERYGWTPAEFLDQTCRKAGMQPGCWQDAEAKISAFSAEVFSEEDFD